MTIYGPTTGELSYYLFHNYRCPLYCFCIILKCSACFSSNAKDVVEHMVRRSVALNLCSYFCFVPGQVVSTGAGQFTIYNLNRKYAVVTCAGIFNRMRPFNLCAVKIISFKIVTAMLPGTIIRPLNFVITFPFRMWPSRPVQPVPKSTTTFFGKTPAPCGAMVTVKHRAVQSAPSNLAAVFLKKVFRIPVLPPIPISSLIPSHWLKHRCK